MSDEEWREEAKKIIKISDDLDAYTAHLLGFASLKDYRKFVLSIYDDWEGK